MFLSKKLSFDHLKIILIIIFITYSLKIFRIYFMKFFKKETTIFEVFKIYNLHKVLFFIYKYQTFPLQSIFNIR